MYKKLIQTKRWRALTRTGAILRRWGDSGGPRPVPPADVRPTERTWRAGAGVLHKMAAANRIFLKIFQFYLSIILLVAEEWCLDRREGDVGCEGEGRGKAKERKREGKRDIRIGSRTKIEMDNNRMRISRRQQWETDYVSNVRASVRHYADGQPVCDRIRKTATSTPRNLILRRQSETEIWNRSAGDEDGRSSKPRPRSRGRGCPICAAAERATNSASKIYITLRILLSTLIQRLRENLSTNALSGKLGSAK
ncbi:hypothetical protein EVAR_74764_1 [Eumeta japonica]|uniref:Uncharacterized protein n=1 Tax=Eumeta variegata TaxID=151549 RepID=A0A4C1SPU3_EUMVA|nr:hypothetical protein EVAR_74764_1 [Eumeta japonica]